MLGEGEYKLNMNSKLKVFESNTRPPFVANNKVSHDNEMCRTLNLSHDKFVIFIILQ